MAAPGPSRRHSKVEPAFEASKVKDGEASLVAPVGPPVMVVSGAAVSTVKVRVAGEASDVAGGVDRADRERVRHPSARPV